MSTMPLSGVPTPVEKVTFTMTANPSYTESFSFDPGDPVFRAHEGGKLEVVPTKALRDRADLALLYTPGVADVSLAIAADPSLAARYTARSNMVAVITDGTAVLGLGNIGPLAALPVMEGKAVLFKHFAGVDAVPVCLETGTVEELVETIVRLAPTYGGINLEDISAPRCFEIERQLQERLDIPVFHDDQHGTAIVVLAALLNALRVVGRAIEDVKIVTTGCGAAGTAVTKILLAAGARTIVGCHHEPAWPFRVVGAGSGGCGCVHRRLRWTGRRAGHCPYGAARHHLRPGQPRS